QFNIAVDLHLVTNQHAATFQGRVPVQSKVLAIKLSRHGKSRPCVSPGILLNTPKLNIENDWFCYASYRQITFQSNVVTIAGIARRLKDEFSIFIDVKKVCRTEVCVALFVARCQ